MTRASLYKKGDKSATPVLAVNMTYVAYVQFDGTSEEHAATLTLGVEEQDGRRHTVHVSDADGKIVKEWLAANSYRGSGAVVKLG